MRWRLTGAQFKASTKDSRAAALEKLAKRATPVGVLAYLDGEPVGWCSIAPRETYAGLERYKALPRLDDEPVWSIVCFFIDRRLRRTALTLGLIRAAVDYARRAGAKIIEAYPVAPDARLYTFMGSPNTFQRAGFRDVTPAGAARSIMRRVVSR
jgi:GNAT superfamily N-acetyltransferase